MNIIKGYHTTYSISKPLDSKNKVKAMNLATNRFLHSHAVKYETGSKQYEVSGCLDGEHEYDFWSLIAENKLENQSIVIVTVINYLKVVPSPDHREYNEIQSEVQN
jgi:dolichyl-phosphate-mannose--protein O-mannosyl transferase